MSAHQPCVAFRAGVDTVAFRTLYPAANPAGNVFGTCPERETRDIYASTGGAAPGSIYAGSVSLGQQGGFYYVHVMAKF